MGGGSEHLMSISTGEEARLLSFSSGCPGLAQTFDRRLINGTLTPGTGVMQCSAIYLPAGLVVTSIVLFTGSTGVTTNTHNWAALITGNLVLMAQSTDDTGGTDFAANTKITKTLTAAQTAPYSGLYYLAWMQAATTPALLLACSAPASSIANNDAPICSGTTGSSLTTAPASPITALAGQIASFYGYVI
jgi:hypothetical protein